MSFPEAIQGYKVGVSNSLFHCSLFDVLKLCAERGLQCACLSVKLACLGGIQFEEVTNRPHGPSPPTNLQGPDGQQTAGGSKGQQNAGVKPIQSLHFH